MSRPWLVLAGGGTGGHLYPGLAVAEAIQRLEPSVEIAVFGTQRQIDHEVVAPRGYELVPQSVRPFPAKPWHWPGFLLAWRSSVAAAKARFRVRRPAVVLGLGGYAAAPAVVAAAVLDIPTALFNPDAVPGRANRRLARHVREIFVQWEDTAREFAGSAATIAVTGCPLRPAVTAATAEQGRAAFKLDAAKRTLLVTGASQGARTINLACLELRDFWKQSPGWQLIHVTGKADFEAVRDAYATAGIDARVMAYTDAMPEALAASDLAISRAGASTLAELTARGVASVLIPYPYDRKQHQRDNAAVLERAGAAVIIDDRKDPTTNAAALRETLAPLMSTDDRRSRMSAAARGLGRADAAQRIAQRLLSMGEIPR